MSAENKELVRRLFHETDRREQADPAMFASGFTAHIGGNPPMTYETFAQFLDSFYVAFADFNHTFLDLVAEGDRVAFRVVARATHTGEFMGIPVTNKQVEVPMIGVARVADGKLAQLWNSPDQLGLLRQIGAIPAPR